MTLSLSLFVLPSVLPALFFFSSVIGICITFGMSQDIKECQWEFESQMVFQGCLRVCQGCVKVVSRIFPECLQAVSRSFMGV